MRSNNKLDYKVLYDGYWQRADRVGERSSDPKKIAQLIGEICGYGSAIDIGCGEGYLVAELLSLDIDAVGLDISSVVVDRANHRWKNRFFCGSILSIPFPDEHFHTVVSTDCMEHLAPDDVPAALREIHRISGRYVFLQIATTSDRGGHWHLTIEGRDWWENRCFEAGFRKHPLYYRVNEYEALNQDLRQIFILLEKIPQKALQIYDLSSLEEERLLHNDMLRVSGRRSDAHCIRYYKACEFIRPGDRVLDVACGLGYGSHILYSASKARSVLGVDLSNFGIAYAQENYGQTIDLTFQCGDAQALNFIPDCSIDFITAFETIEHVPDPIAYLKELKRVLKPAGRVMVCAPNNWVDETGRDPNPHHFHVYTWERLTAEVGSYFLLERGFLQTAGGALKCTQGSRKWVNVPADVASPPEDSEWVVLLGMVDPVARSDVQYEETSWELPEAADFNVTAFARDYKNPWLAKGMVTIGMRMSADKQLVSMQERVLNSCESDSVDYGAALCGRIYSHIQEGNISVTTVKGIEAEVRRYSGIPSPTPHQLRWQISLLYAAGELARKQGRTRDASFFYSECAKRDALPYSPILGNKTLDALFYLAKDAIRTGDFSAAREHLLRSIRECRRLSSDSWINITGAEEHPLQFGLAEMSQLFDKASRASYLLAALAKKDASPFLLYQESMGYYERHIEFYKKWGNDCHANWISLSNQLVGLNEIMAAQKNASPQKEETAHRSQEKELELHGKIDELSKLPMRLEARIDELNLRINEKDSIINEKNRQAAIANLDHFRASEDLRLIKDSLSWRMTAPLRFLGRIVNHALFRYRQFSHLRSERGWIAATTYTIKFLRDGMFPVSQKSLKDQESNSNKNIDVKATATPPVQEVPREIVPVDAGLKVLMLVDTFHDGGVERVVIDLCLCFQRAGITCKILVAKNGGRSAAEARSHDIEVIELHEDTGALRSLLEKCSDTVAISHHCYISLDEFHMAGIPVIEVIHNAYHWQRGNEAITRMRARDFVQFIAVSRFVKEFSIKELAIDSERMSVINNGLSNEGLIRPPLELLGKKRLDTLGAPVFLHVANLHPQKNHRLVVNAFRRVKDKYPKARLVIAGAMDGYSKVLATLQRDIELLDLSESITLTGALPRRELSKLMSSAHIGLLPSMLEGFSIATLELTFFGLPIVLSATGAADELEEAYGHVRIVKECALPHAKLNANNIESILEKNPENSVEALAEAMLDVLNNYSSHLGSALSAAGCFEQYSINTVAEKYMSLLWLIKERAAYA